MIKRIWQHKNVAVKGFTNKYQVKNLVYYEQHFTAESAISREKQLKKWDRKWKIELIERMNPDWEDLYQKIL